MYLLDGVGQAYWQQGDGGWPVSGELKHPLKANTDC